MKIPKRYSGFAKTMVDPLGLGLGDAIFGEGEGPDYSAEQAAQEAAIAEGRLATEDFIKGGAAEYDVGDELGFRELGPADRLGDSSLADIRTDPEYRQRELMALRELEDQSRNGFTARDRADMARTEADVNRANRGRVGAIQQSMQARGRGGSEMDALMQMQSAQDANEIAAFRALEQDAMMQDRKSRATMGLGQMSSQLQQRDFNQAATKAQAADAIERFNTQNAIQQAQYNNQGQNQAQSANWNRTNSVSDQNSRSKYDFQRDTLGARQNQAGMNYNYSVEGENRRRLEDQQRQEAAGGKAGALLGIAGGVVGGIYGGPAGATAGYQVGSGVGKQVGQNAYRNNQGYAHGGKVPGEAPFEGDHPENDVVQALLSPDEIVIPRSISDDPAAAADFVAEENGQDNDVVGLLLQAMSKINKGER